MVFFDILVAVRIEMSSAELFCEYQHLKIEEICRICFIKKDQMILIREARVADMLLECASVQVTYDDELYLVCNTCVSEINRWNVFRRQVVKSFEIGRWLIEKSKIGIKTELIDATITGKEDSNNSVLSEKMYKSDDNNDKVLDLREHSHEADLSGVINTENNSNDVSCGHCGKVCLNPIALCRHEKVHNDDVKNFECTKCGKCFKQSQTLADHVRRHYDSRNYACELCGKKFYKLFNVTEHMRIHTGERPFKCEYCPRTFTRGLLLRNHIKKTHTGEKKYVCDICSKGFVDGYQLKIHMRTHTGEKPYPCDECDKAFAMQGQLKSHMKYKHTREKDFICNICGRAFTAKHTLEEHLRTHTGEKKQPRHECITCGKKCLTTTQLKIHIRSAHTGERPFPCHVCSKSFVTRTAMESHMRTHTGEKSFICCDCGKAFSAKSSLKIHERIHSGERPFECTVCGKTFTQGSTLKTHLKVHTE